MFRLKHVFTKIGGSHNIIIKIQRNNFEVMLSEHRSLTITSASRRRCGLYLGNLFDSDIIVRFLSGERA